MVAASLVDEPLGGADGERKALLNLESGVCLIVDSKNGAHAV